MHKQVTPETASRIIVNATKPVLLVCFHEEKDLKKAEALFDNLPDSYLERIEICLAGIHHIDGMKERFQILGTPSIVLYDMETVKDTFLGQFGREDLISFLEDNSIP